MQKVRKVLSYIVIILIGFLFSTCSKNDKGNDDGVTKFDEIFEVNFTIDGKNFSKAYPKGTKNPGKVIYRETSPGHFYFSRGCYMILSPNSIFSFYLGTTQGSWPGPFESFKQLMSPGTKIYDSLEHCVQQQINRVEIVFVDEDNNTWSSTKWTFLNNRQVNKTVNQLGSNFEITEVKVVSTSTNSENNAVIIKGKFNCTMYKANSDEKQSLNNGSFNVYVGHG